MNRAESKYFATAARMDEAFLELIEKKDFAYITVKEICEKAGVNRSTFYLHYETAADLLAESAQYIIDRFVEAMPHDAAEFLKKLPDRPLEELYLITPEYLTPYLTYIREHRRIFRTTVEQAAVLRMNDAYGGLERHVVMPILERFRVPDADWEYIMAFYIDGLMAIINKWLRDDCRDSIEHIISVMKRCAAPLTFRADCDTAPIIRRQTDLPGALEFRRQYSRYVCIMRDRTAFWRCGFLHVPGTEKHWEKSVLSSFYVVLWDFPPLFHVSQI